MPRNKRDLDWDGLQIQDTAALVDSKRALERLDQQRVGWEPDWKLRVLMIKEEREAAFAEACSRGQRARIAKDPAGHSKQRSEFMVAAWQRGAFAGRVVGCSKRTDEKVATARKMRDAGVTLKEIGCALGVTEYSVAKWLGWKRKERPTNRCPVMLYGVQYESQRAAARETGLDRGYIRRVAVKVKP